MKYQILRTDKASDQLYEIIQYIAEDAGDVSVALHYLDKIESAIMNLGESPNMGSHPRYTTLKRQGYRVLIVERHLVFYKVDAAEKTVMIHAVIDGRRAYRNLV